MSGGRLMVPVRGAGGGGGGGGATEQADTIRSTQTADIVDLLGEGEIEGLTNGLRSIYLDGVPLQNADGSFNFDGVQVTFTPGTQGQASITGADGVQTEQGVGVDVLFATPVVRTVTNPAVDKVRVTIAVPQLSETDAGNGNLHGSSFSWSIEVQSAGGGYVEVMRETVAEKTMSRYTRSKVFALAGPAPWDIRLKRLTADATNSNTVNKFGWATYTEMRSLRLRHPNSALVRLRLPAQQFSHIPLRGYDVMGARVKVPTNYDPRTKAYTGVWDGTFKIAWTDCPAWLYYAAVENPRYGLGRYFQTGPLLKFALYGIGRYCDAMVPDGRGGMEPRFRAGFVLSTREQAYKVLADLAAIFRGMAYWANTDVSVVQDAPGDPVALFTPANVVGGKFTYAGASHTKRHTQVTVWFNDLAQQGKLVPEVVTDRARERRYGVKPLELSPLGIWSRGQANRVGKWALYSEQYEGATATFRVGLDGVLVPPGKVFQIADPTEAGERLGGRVHAATTSVVTLDSPVMLSPGESYTLTVMLPDPVTAGGMLTQQRPVTTAAGTTAVLTVASAFSAAPAVQSVWLLQSDAVQATTWRCLALNEVADSNEFEISALRHHPQKYDLIEQGIAFDTPTVSRIKTVPPPPASLLITETVYAVGVTARSRVSVSWPAPAAGLSYLVSWRLQSGPWTDLPSTGSNLVDVDGLQPGLFECTVRSVNSIGNASRPLAGSLTLLGEAGTSVRLQASAQTFAFDALGQPKPGGQVISLVAQRVNLAGTATITVTGYAANGAASVLQLGGSGEARTLTVTDFGASKYAVATAAVGNRSAQVTISRVADGAAGDAGPPGVSAASVRLVSNNLNAYNAGFTAGPVLQLASGAAFSHGGRGHTLVVIKPATSEVVSWPAAFDTYTLSSATSGLLAALAAVGDGMIAALFTWDACSCDAPLRSALQGFGAGSSSTWAPDRVSHAFVGVRGLARGQAYEASSSAATAAGVVVLQAYYSASGLVLNGAIGSPGQAGGQGPAGAQAAPVYLYQWATAQPASPAGTSTFTWSTGVNSGYTNTSSDNWQVDVPANPGFPGIKFWVAKNQATGTALATTSSVNWASGSTVAAWANNGANGAAGIHTATPTVFQWAPSIPSPPAGNATYTWASGTFGAAPAFWALNPGMSPSPGFTLWAAAVPLSDSAANPTTQFNWTSAGVTARGYAGTAGGQGVAGAGARIAYAKVNGSSLAPTPPTVTTNGDPSFPPPGSWGGNEVWGPNVPAFGANESVWQTNGVYSPASGQTVWGVPYLSNWKVGNLAAITVNTGALNVTGDIHLTSGALLGGAFTGWAWPTAGGTGLYLGPNGLLLGNYYSGSYLQVSANGDIFSPAFEVVNGVSTALAVRVVNGRLQGVGLGSGTPVDNTTVTLAADGTLGGTSGGGKVTLPGMGQHVYRAVGRGFSATAPVTPGLYVDGALLAQTPAISYTVYRVRRTDGVVTYANAFNVHAGGSASADMAAVLNSTGSDQVVVVITDDEPAGNRLTGGLPAAMYRCGASRAVFGSPAFEGRSAYVLIGIPGCGEGNGAEGYQGAFYSDPAAFVDMSFSLVSGVLAGVSNSYTPRTLADYAYSGDLNATYGAQAGANLKDSGGAVLGDTAIKNSYISLGTDGTLVGGSGGRVTLPGMGYSGDLNATRGAPAGTPVAGSFPGGASATSVEGWAYGGALAYNAVTDAATGLSTRLMNNARNVLSGGAGLVAGSLTWDGAGNRTGGYGVALNARGIVGYDSVGNATVTINASTGAIAVRGDISGSSGRFVGEVSVNDTTYDTGTGFWTGIHEGLAKFRVGSPTQYFRWNGYAPEIKIDGPPTVMGGHFARGYQHPAIGNASSFAAIEFRPDGSIWLSGTGVAAAKSGDWYSPNAAAVGSGFEVRFDRDAGTPATGLTSNATGGWFGLGAARYQQLAASQSGSFVRLATGSYAVRRASDGLQVGSGSWSLEASGDAAGQIP